ncbi:MAG TPA: hypothetical protein VFA12_03515 [Stellaceae bacterium]|nr:hypothetical protein [Stellaceae bacterium]
MIAALRLERGMLVRYGAPAAVIAACAGLLGWNAGETTLPAMPTPAATPWALPPPNREDPGRDLAVLTQRKPWNPGLLGTAKTPQNAPPSWRLAGIVRRGDSAFALIEIGSGAAAKLEYKRVGETLPNGGTLAALSADSAVVKDGKDSPGEKVYKLFDRKP